MVGREGEPYGSEGETPAELDLGNFGQNFCGCAIHLYILRTVSDSWECLRNFSFSMLLNVLPKHPKFDVEFPAEKEKAKEARTFHVFPTVSNNVGMLLQKVVQAISSAEKIKKTLLIRYEAEEKTWKKEQVIGFLPANCHILNVGVPMGALLIAYRNQQTSAWWSIPHIFPQNFRGQKRLKEA